MRLHCAFLAADRACLVLHEESAEESAEKSAKYDADDDDVIRGQNASANGYHHQGEQVALKNCWRHTAPTVGFLPALV